MVQEIIAVVSALAAIPGTNLLVRRLCAVPEPVQLKIQVILVRHCVHKTAETNMHKEPIGSPPTSTFQIPTRANVFAIKAAI